MSVSIVQFLEARWGNLRIVFILSALISSLLLNNYISHVVADEERDLDVSINLANGVGFVKLVANTNDLSSTIPFYLIRSTPGYFTLIAAASPFTDDPGTADAILDDLASFLFIISVALIIDGISTHISVIGKAIYWVYLIAFPGALLVSRGHTSGSLAVAFFAFAIALGMMAIKKERWSRLLFAFIGGAAIAAAVSMRYDYWPISIVLPAAFLFSQKKPNENDPRKQKLFYGFTILLSILLPIIMMSLIMGINYSNTGSIVRDYPGIKGIFLDQILLTIPFPAYSVGIIDSSFPQTVFGPIPEPGFSISRGIASIISIFLTTIALYSFIITIQKSAEKIGAPNSVDNNRSGKFLGWAAIVTFLTVLASLGFLSVARHKFTEIGEGWVALGELRYFAALIFILPIGLLLFVFPNNATGNSSNKRKWISALIVLILIVPMLNLVSWRTRVAIIEYSRPWPSLSERFSERTSPLRRTIEDLDPEMPYAVVYEFEDNFLRNMIAGAGGIGACAVIGEGPIPNAANYTGCINLFESDITLPVTKPTQIIFAVFKSQEGEDAEIINALINSYHADLVFENESYILYTFVAAP